jgi:hypothetical protein
MSIILSLRLASLGLLLHLICIQRVLSQTGSSYVLDTEYSGANFFDGWEFFTVSDQLQGTSFLLDFVLKHYRDLTPRVDLLGEEN